MIVFLNERLGNFHQICQDVLDLFNLLYILRLLRDQAGVLVAR